MLLKLKGEPFKQRTSLAGGITPFLFSVSLPFLEATLVAELGKCFHPILKSTMADWHYYNENREKIGPVTSKQLKQLVQQGTITPETFVEDPNGRTGLAKDVKGLPFAETVASESSSVLLPPFAESNSSTATSHPSQNTMLNYFYFDANGHKQGPATEQQLHELIQQGIVGPKSPLETEGGHRGVAGQIPGLFSAAPQKERAAPVPPTTPPPPPPINLFCTNCGNTVSEKAVACMSCGAKPTGHKKFCRQCGVGLNPEQVVCVQCGAGITGGFQAGATTMAASAMENLKNASIPEKIKKLPKPAMIAGISTAVVLCLAFFLYGGSSPSAVVRQYLIAIEKSDLKTIRKICTPQRGAGFDGNSLNYYRESMIRENLTHGEIGSLSHTITGNNATVDIVFRDGRTGTYRLLRIDGRWKISN